ncbi:30S ribosomal protein-like protein S7 [Pleomassaria siparia CBS 279.74]|uniref:Small ribosomal subunit protein uS7m n=1 Tax=Pleomassaria siparia CBS 279.74 TaxID=1314801 RepID=A0A6G1K0U7_9PLEO|nr:30S ribosomal protein-like protein S7 [Pleomassaria siparia CBS 279.74]
MSPRLSLFSFARSIPYRPRLSSQWLPQPATRATPSKLRAYSNPADQAPSGADRSTRPETKPADHVSEEAAKVADITGTQGPDMEQGTPVEQVVKGDQEAIDKLPKVMQDKLKGKSPTSAPKGSRSYSTMTTSETGSAAFDMGLVGFNSASTVPEIPGVKFGLPSLPLPRDGNLKHRYDTVVDQVTNLLMRHGQKSIAQRNMSLILQHLRTSQIPTINPARPLVPGAPPPSHLPLNPILYLTLAIDSVAPLLRIRNQKGAAGGGVALQIPVPLGIRQRRRTAVEWILNAASKRRNKGSGKGGFAQRVADELVAVVEGKSGVWERRNAVHKLAVASRANVVLPRKR